MKKRCLQVLSSVLAAVLLVSVMPLGFAADSSHPTPDYLNLNLPKERLESAEAGAAYQYSTNFGSTWREFIADADGYLDISGILYVVDIEFYVRRAASGGFSASESYAVALPKKGAGPTKNEVRITYVGVPDGKAKFLIDSLGNTIEYRKAFTKEWIPCAGELEVDAPGAVERTLTFSFRYQGTASTSPSSTVNRTIYTPKGAPSLAFSLANEVISNIQRGKMEAALDDGGYEDLDDFEYYSKADNKIYLKEIIDDIVSPATRVIRIRLKGTDAAPPSADKVITLFGRRDAPESLFYDEARMKITGITSQMEYRLKPLDPAEYNKRKWSSTTKKEIDVSKFVSAESDVEFEVRYKATKTTAASWPTDYITLNKLEDGPSFSVNMAEERLEGLDPDKNYQYSKNNKTFTTFTADKDGFYSISRLLGSSRFILYVRKAATQTEPYTAATAVEIGPRSGLSAAFRLEYSDTEVKIIGTKDTMEYRVLPNKDLWSDCSNDMTLPIPSADMTIAIRTKAADGKAPSAEKTVKISAGKSSPSSIKYDATAELLSGLARTMQISVNDSPFEDYSGAESTLSLSSIIPAVGGGTVTVRVRVKAAGSQPPTAPKVFTIYPRAEAPASDSFEFNADSKEIGGTSSKMQYRAYKSGASEPAKGWTSIPGKKLNVKNLIAENYTKVEIRVKPVAGVSSASLSVEVSIEP